MEDSSCPESHALIVQEVRRESSWTWQDYKLLVMGLLISFGDGIELYLPGVLTQYASCESGASKIQEGWLGCVLYLSLGVTTLVGGFVSDQLKGRQATLLSLYGSSLSIILCAIYGDYYILLITRVIVGTYLGLNLSVFNVLIAERASSKKVFETILFGSNLIFTFGGVWIPTLGYFLLDVVGWRFFVLMASLPVFVPAICILHFFMVAPLSYIPDCESEVKFQPALKVPDFITRICKMSIFKAALTYHGWGTILLLPSLIQLSNTTEVEQSCTHCEAVTEEFLALALANGAAVLGGLVAIKIRKRVNFRLVFTLLAAVNVLSYTAILLIQQNLIIIALTSITVMFSYGMTQMAASSIMYDERYFGKRNLTLACGITTGIGVIGGASGATVASLATPWIAVISGLAVSVVEIIVTMSMFEQDHL